MGDSNAEVSVGDGGWIRFRTTRVVASLIEQIREAMEGLLREKIANPCVWLRATRSCCRCCLALAPPSRSARVGLLSHPMCANACETDGRTSGRAQSLCRGVTPSSWPPLRLARCARCVCCPSLRPFLPAPPLRLHAHAYIRSVCPGGEGE